MLRLKEIREKNKVSQTELAEYLNLTQVQISKYELGKNEPDLRTIKKIATYFDVTIDYLLGTEEKDIILITRNDLETLKESTDNINKIINKITSTNGFQVGNNSNIQIGSNITYKNKTIKTKVKKNN